MKKANEKIKPPVKVPSAKKEVSKDEPEEEINPLDEIRQTMVAVLWRKESVPVSDLIKLTKKEVKSVSGEEFQKLFDKVLKKLLSIKLVEEVNDPKPAKIRIVQRLNI